MNKPLFVSDAYSAQPEHPSNWSVEPLIGENTSVTLNGTQVNDVFYRKYKYVLEWEAMSKSDYEALEAVVNNHVDVGTNITFTYAKWGTLASGGVACMGRLSARGFKAGSGNTSYYSSVTLELVEVNSRI